MVGLVLSGEVPIHPHVRNVGAVPLQHHPTPAAAAVRKQLTRFVLYVLISRGLQGNKKTNITVTNTVSAKEGKGCC